MAHRNLAAPKVYNGRTVTAATYWWAKNTEWPKSSLWCIHDKKLSEPCTNCSS